MPRVADYSIIADGWVLEFSQNSINFEVPSTIDAGSRSILGFMLHVECLGDMTLTLRINGTKVWDWNFPEGKYTRFFQEVIDAGLVKSGTNVFSFQSTSGITYVKLSDIVLWWQANVF
jgi:hypothetical protein